MELEKEVGQMFSYVKQLGYAKLGACAYCSLSSVEQARECVKICTDLLELFDDRSGKSKMVPEKKAWSKKIFVEKCKMSDDEFEKCFGHIWGMTMVRIGEHNN